MSKATAVLISDVHYSLKNLELADSAMKEAIVYANKNKLLLIVAGDLHDTKANIRAEVMNRMIETFRSTSVRIWVMIGNHDRINEKSPEHALEFLSPFVTLVNKPYTFTKNWHLIPYHSHEEELHLDYAKGSVLIMHQGVHGADKGDYVKDDSAIDEGSQ